MSHSGVSQSVSSYPIFERCRKLIDPGDKKPLEEYIIKLSPAEYKTFIILAHSLEVFILRGIKDEPMFEK